MPTAVRVMKENLRKVSTGLKRLQEDEGLARWALIALMHDRTKLPKSTIGQVLDGLESLVDEAFANDD